MPNKKFLPNKNKFTSKSNNLSIYFDFIKTPARIVLQIYEIIELFFFVLLNKSCFIYFFLGIVFLAPFNLLNLFYCGTEIEEEKINQKIEYL